MSFTDDSQVPLATRYNTLAHQYCVLSRDYERLVCNGKDDKYNNATTCVPSTLSAAELAELRHKAMLFDALQDMLLHKDSVVNTLSEAIATSDERIDSLTSKLQSVMLENTALQQRLRRSTLPQFWA
jgi:hypothetical protein